MPPPKGYTLDTGPKLPAGYTLDQSTPDRPAGLPAGQILPGVPAHPPANLTAPIPGYTDNPDVVSRFARGVLKSIPGTAAGVAKLVPGTRDAWEPGEAAAQTHNTAEAVGKGVGNAAQFLIPMAGEEAAGAAIASRLPQGARMLGRVIPAALDSGIINKAQGGTFKGGVAAGLTGEAVGAGLRKIAPAIAESALGINAGDRINGRETGEAILRHTRGVLPQTVEKSAGDVIGRETRSVEDLSRNAPPVSLIPARQAADKFVGNAAMENVPSEINAIKGLRDVVDTRHITGTPIPPIVSASEALSLKRGVGKYLPEGTWNPSTNSTLAPARNAMYGALNDEFLKSVPEAAESNAKISALIPVERRAEMAARKASNTGEILGRLKAPTGAAASALGLGAAAGYATHSPAGYLMGAALPILASNPTAQMTAARLSYNPLFRGIIRSGIRATPALLRDDDQ